MPPQHCGARLRPTSVRSSFARLSRAARPRLRSPFSGGLRMIRRTAAALVALSLSATVAMAQPPESPDRAERAGRAAVPRAAAPRADEPGSPGPVVERRTERGANAGEHKISDADIATAPLMEQAKSSHHTVTINGQT